MKIAKNLNLKNEATITAKLLLWWLLCFFVCSTPARACDTDDFVYQEFGQRCLRLAELTVQLKTAYKFSLPDRDKFKRQLLNEWVDFYIDHGETPPAGFSNIATSSWQATLKFTGNEINNLTRLERINEFSDSAKIPLQLLAQPVLFSQTREAVASWALLFKEAPTDQIVSETIWLSKNATTLVKISGLIAAIAPYERKRIRQFLDELNYNWQYVLHADKIVAQSIFKFASAELREKLAKEFKHWQILTFM